LTHDFEIVTVNGGERTSLYHTQLAVAKFTGKRKKIKSCYFIATPGIYILQLKSNVGRVKPDKQLTAVLHNKHTTCVQLTNTAVYTSATAQLSLLNYI